MLHLESFVHLLFMDGLTICNGNISKTRNVARTKMLTDKHYPSECTFAQQFTIVHICSAT